MDDFGSLRKKIITQRDLVNCFEQLSQLEDLVYDKDAPLSSIAESVVSPLLQEVFENREEDLVETEKQIEFLEKIEAYLEDFDRLRLTIAFPASREFLEKIKADLAKKIDSEFVVDLSVDPKIIGGAKLEYQGRYLDFSLKAQLDSIFKSEF